MVVNFENQLLEKHFQSLQICKILWIFHNNFGGKMVVFWFLCLQASNKSETLGSKTTRQKRSWLVALLLHFDYINIVSRVDSVKACVTQIIPICQSSISKGKISTLEGFITMNTYLSMFCGVTNQKTNL